ncbi:MAG: NAD(P)-dependent oxidoreductase [Caldimonas sp.]
MKALLLTEPMPAAPFYAAISALAPELELIEYRPSLGETELAAIDIAIGWRLPDGLAARMPRLGWVCSIAAGVEKLLRPELAPHVIVSRIVDPAQAAGIAQFVVTMVLRHARSLELYEVQQRERSWRRQPTPLATHRVAVLGTGAMGGEIVEWLGRVGFAARGWNRRSAETFHQVLAQSDVVVCALPLTDATEGILGAHAFACMPRGSYLVNVARGAHVVEPDLIAAVRSGHLGGAALDVQRHEPMPADDPLWTVPGITITPHIAAQSSTVVIATQFVAALRALQRGEEVPNAIDRMRGY